MRVCTYPKIGIRTAMSTRSKLRVEPLLEVVVVDDSASFSSLTTALDVTSIGGTNLLVLVTVGALLLVLVAATGVSIFSSTGSSFTGGGGRAGVSATGAGGGESCVCVF